eukprot:CAMPEP_0180385444 /NCGR_PEP_ID=MMETSP0989-20121125/29108_1 /TAXON_ID=697907 /ORGANISM="non described non described, Strain CCMP2293" /LENGTH=188 /DNA_ID=CAMNT_0022386039 /DNA_START=50 /DNA_END=617 /DNA_ORIENTATION=-
MEAVDDGVSICCSCFSRVSAPDTMVKNGNKNFFANDATSSTGSTAGCKRGTMEAVDDGVSICCSCFSRVSAPDTMVKNGNKNFFANERNFIHWIHMGATLGSVATLIAQLGDDDATGFHKDATLFSSCALCVCAIVFVIYAIQVYYWRIANMRLNQGTIDEPYGPLILAGLLMTALSGILVTQFIPIV